MAINRQELRPHSSEYVARGTANRLAELFDKRMSEVDVKRDENGFVESEFDGITFIAPSADQMTLETLKLAQRIIESDKKFDLVVALAKGGWTWTRTLVDSLKLDAITSIRIQLYSGINQANAEPKITDPLSVSVKGKHILLFDEVVDSGRTFKEAVVHLREAGAASVTTATLCYKDKRSEIAPDYYAFTTDAWVVFPHEYRETIDEMREKWLEKGITINEIKNRLLLMGIPTEYVSAFC